MIRLREIRFFSRARVYVCMRARTHTEYITVNYLPRLVRRVHVETDARGDELFRRECAGCESAVEKIVRNRFGLVTWSGTKRKRPLLLKDLVCSRVLLCVHFVTRGHCDAAVKTRLRQEIKIREFYGNACVIRIKTKFL